MTLGDPIREYLHKLNLPVENNFQEIKILYAQALRQQDLPVEELSLLFEILRLLPVPLQQDLQTHVLLLLMFLTRAHGAPGMICRAEPMLEYLRPADDQQQLFSLKEMTAIIQEIRHGKWDICISRNEADLNAPLIWHDHSLYFQRSFVVLSTFNKLLQARLDDNVIQGLHHEQVHEVLSFTFKHPPLVVSKTDSSSKPLLLSNEQIMAVCLGVCRKTILISGGPGTGKTSVITSILRALLRLCAIAGQNNPACPVIRPQRIFLLAPTGKAARRLQDSLRQQLASCSALDDLDQQLLEHVQAQTLHKFLRMRPGRSFYHDHDLTCPADLVVVDECSMVDMELMQHLLSALPAHCRLIMAGDQQQLPPVEQGGFLTALVRENPPQFSADLLNTVAPFCDGRPFSTPSPAMEENFSGPTDFHVALRTDFRAGWILQQLSAKIIAGDFNCDRDLNPEQRMAAGLFIELKSLDALNDFTLVETAAEQQGPSMARTWWGLYMSHLEMQTGQTWLDMQNILRQRGHVQFMSTLLAVLHIRRQWQILTMTHQGACGTRMINEHLNQVMTHASMYKVDGALQHGAPLLITRNDDINQLNNGDMGLILQLSHGAGNTFHAAFQQGDDLRILPLQSLSNFEMGYAMTVHKAQGSEYEHVLLLLPETAHRLLRREIIFTAITRAKSKAVLAGSADMLDFSVSKSIHPGGASNHLTG